MTPDTPTNPQRERAIGILSFSIALLICWALVAWIGGKPNPGFAIGGIVYALAILAVEKD